MPRVEGEITIPPEQRYATIVSEFERERREILNPPQVSVSLSPWRRLFGARTQQKTVPSLEEQLAQLEVDFKRQIFSDRSLVVRHLRANPDRQEAIIADYLQSSELLQDANTLGQFFAFWLLEFFQKADTGPIENLFNFIQTSASRLLPPELHQARSEIFEPLFAILSGKEKEIFKNIKEAGIFDIGQNLAKALIETNQPLPEKFKEAYKRYVDQLVKIEAGIISIGPAEPEPKKPKNRAERNKKSSPAKPKSNEKVCPQTETPNLVEIPVYSFWIVLGPNKNPIQIKNPEELKEIMRKIKNLGPVTAEDVWKSLQEITSTPPPQIPSRYRERVAGGPFKGWWKKNLGGKYRLIFSIKDGGLHFRVGPDETVYATSRRKPPDRARSL